MSRLCRQMIHVPEGGFERCEALTEMRANIITDKDNKNSERWEYSDGRDGFCVFHPLERTDYCMYHHKVRKGLCKTK